MGQCRRKGISAKLFSHRDLVLHQGLPMPFGHAGLAAALKFLFFQTTGCIGVSFQSWYGDRFMLCAIAFVLAQVSLLSMQPSFTSSLL
jgi:hypothetical protein